METRNNNIELTKAFTEHLATSQTCSGCSSVMTFFFKKRDDPFIYLSIFGYVGSSFLCEGFL